MASENNRALRWRKRIRQRPITQIIQRIEWHGSWKPIAEFAIDAAESDCVDAMANGNRQRSVRRIAFAFSYCNVHVAGVLYYCSVAARLSLS